MTFQEAERELKELAKGRYYAISYEVLSYMSGSREAECTVYVDAERHHSGATWREALDKLRDFMDVKREAVSEEAPKEELGKKETI